MSQSPKKAKKKEAASSNVFSMFEQSQIQEFKEVRNTDITRLQRGPYPTLFLFGFVTLRSDISFLHFTASKVLTISLRLFLSKGAPDWLFLIQNPESNL